jgi:hypothetical protein
VNHVHLVVISKLVSHIRPGLTSETRLVFENRLEPGDPHEELGTQAHLLQEPPLKLSYAQPCSVRESRDANAAASEDDSIGRGRNTIEAVCTKSLMQQELIDETHALLERSSVTEAFPGMPNKPSQDRLSLIVLVGQFVHMAGE